MISRFRKLLLAALSAASFAHATDLQAQSTSLLLFSGDPKREFLGCLNCGRYDSSSICNPYGAHGSKYAGESIWNNYGTYGSKYSDLSPWNQYADQAPVIVDRAGRYYGRLSANRYHAERTRIAALNALTDNIGQFDDPEGARTLLCGE